MRQKPFIFAYHILYLVCPYFLKLPNILRINMMTDDDEHYYDFVTMLKLSALSSTVYPS